MSTIEFERGRVPTVGELRRMPGGEHITGVFDTGVYLQVHFGKAESSDGHRELMTALQDALGKGAPTGRALYEWFLHMLFVGIPVMFFWVTIAFNTVLLPLEIFDLRRASLLEIALMIGLVASPAVWIIHRWAWKRAKRKRQVVVRIPVDNDLDDWGLGSIGYIGRIGEF